MNCPYCDTEQAEETKFCTNCGKYIGDYTIQNTVEASPAEELPEEPAFLPVIPEEPVLSDSPALTEEADESPAEDPVPSIELTRKEEKPSADGPWAGISTLGWIGIKLLISVPIVGAVFVIVWSFGGCRKNVKKTFSRATLILALINAIICVVSLILILTHIPALVSVLGKLAVLVGKVTLQ